LRVSLVAVGVLASLTALWVLSSRSISPEQRIARAEPPPPAVVDMQLEQRRLEETVEIRGRLAAGDVLEVMPPEGGGEAAASVPVVVDLPHPVGEEVSAGGVIAVVSDRPLLAIPLQIPLHRTLLPNDEGPDVERLQEALGQLGYSAGTDGRFGAMAQRAVRQLYEDRGFEPPMTGPPADVESEGAPPEALPGAAPERGVIASRGELVGVARLPAVVAQLPTPVGRPVREGPVAVLAPPALLVEAQVDPTRAMTLQPGMRGTATVEGRDVSFEVEVAGAQGDTRSQDAGTRAMTFMPLTPQGADLLGTSVRVEIVLAASDGEVLAAPVGAVRSDGRGEYLLLVDEGETQRVGFVPGASIGGWVEVTAPEVPLSPGDEVRAG
jgi:peptidoglycan hydrolase-like protein with peptidoglycan-binding domain